MINLENWSLHQDNDNEFLDPELRGKFLRGIVFNHPKLEDGAYIHTSKLKSLDLLNRLAVTTNTTYTLGSINKEYLEHSIKHKYKDTPLLEKFNIYFED